MEEKLKLGRKVQTALELGNIVSIQNQVGPRAKKWDKTGIIVEVLPYDQYRVKVDGSGQVTLRNRQFLRRLAAGDEAAAPTQPLPQSHVVGVGYVSVGGQEEEGRYRD